MSYPVASGARDYAGHGVFGWSSGFASNAVTVGTGTGDIMGDCLPAWSGACTYKAILAFRRRLPVMTVRAADAGPVTEEIEIRGTLDRGTGIAGVSAIAERVVLQSSRRSRTARAALRDRTRVVCRVRA